MTPDDAWFHVVDALPVPLTDKVREAVEVLAVLMKEAYSR